MVPAAAGRRTGGGAGRQASTIFIMYLINSHMQSLTSLFE